MRKGKLFMVVLVGVLLFSGCGKEEVPVEDYVRSNPPTSGMNPIMKSETGYYYCTTGYEDMSLHYYDVASGQNIYLCSKPECRHDGDAFCTATSEKYHVKGACFYGGNLYLDVTEATDTEHLYKLLRVSADGSELTEVITYMTVNNTSVRALVGGEQMMIHRGVAVLPYQLLNMGEAMAGNITGITGTYLYNLATGELTGLPELEFGTDSNGRERFNAFGDYIYYNTNVEHKNTLSRYNLSDGTVEDLALQTGYNGTYEIIDEDTVYYLRAGNTLYEYEISTGNTGRHDNVFVNKMMNRFDGMEFETKTSYTCVDMAADDTYFYVGEGVYFRHTGTGYVGSVVYADGTEENLKSQVHVFDKELNEVAVVEIATEPYLGYEEYFSVAILDGTVYLQTSPTVFACTLEEFLAGGLPNFQPVYDNEIEIQTMKEK